ncbi:MAG: hypothetical protein F6J93_38910 [Oscillatoria sp. SIO1A7]|nr:hypothetical protein [Oscillatoria sp. SIO1A7]
MSQCKLKLLIAFVQKKQKILAKNNANAATMLCNDKETKASASLGKARKASFPSRSRSLFALVTD